MTRSDNTAYYTIQPSVVCLAAVKRDGRALKHVSEGMKTLELNRAAIKNSYDDDAWQFVPDALRDKLKNVKGKSTED